MNKCEFCLDYIDWCKCPEDCAKGFHWWAEDKERCKRCKIAREKVVSLTPQEK